MKKIVAIYVILNCVNGKAYLGSTGDFKVRRNVHFSELRNGKHGNKHLQRAWNKYGEDNFTIFPIEKFNKIPSDTLLKKEAEYIKQYDLTNRDRGYNIVKDALAPMTGRNHTKKAKEEIGLASLGRPGFWTGKKNPEHSKRMSGKGNPMYGKPGTTLGKKLTPEHKEKICLAAKRSKKWGRPKKKGENF